MDQIVKQAATFQNEHLKAFIKGGGKVVGYGCALTPVEVIEAAGLLPYRIRALGNTQTEIADAHLARFNCSFCRSCLQLGLDGTYDFFDGIIETNGCDHLRGMFENWQYVKPVEFFHYLKVPHIADPESIAYFVEELGLFRKALEKGFGKKISDKALWKQIEQQEAIRGKLRTLHAMRERTAPALTGAEMLAVTLLGSAVPAATFVALLDRVIVQRDSHVVPDYRARLMLCGSATDEFDFIREMESIGGLVVTDALCYGHRAYWTPVQRDDGTPEDTLARLYLENLLCPRMYDDYSRRRKFVFDAVERAAVDGVVVVHNKFCDVHGVDNVHLRIDLENKGVPVLQLEKEYGTKADQGRMKTRVQAFLERIGDR